MGKVTEVTEQCEIGHKSTGDASHVVSMSNSITDFGGSNRKQCVMREPGGQHYKTLKH